MVTTWTTGDVRVDGLITLVYDEVCGGIVSSEGLVKNVAPRRAMAMCSLTITTVIEVTRLWRAPCFGTCY